MPRLQRSRTTSSQKNTRRGKKRKQVSKVKKTTQADIKAIKERFLHILGSKEPVVVLEDITSSFYDRRQLLQRNKRALHPLSLRNNSPWEIQEKSMLRNDAPATKCKKDVNYQDYEKQLYSSLPRTSKRNTKLNSVKVVLNNILPQARRRRKAPKKVKTNIPHLNQFHTEENINKSESVVSDLINTSNMGSIRRAKLVNSSRKIFNSSNSLFLNSFNVSDSDPTEIMLPDDDTFVLHEEPKCTVKREEAQTNPSMRLNKCYDNNPVGSYDQCKVSRKYSSNTDTISSCNKTVKLQQNHISLTSEKISSSFGVLGTNKAKAIRSDIKGAGLGSSCYSSSAMSTSSESECFNVQRKGKTFKLSSESDLAPCVTTNIYENVTTKDVNEAPTNKECITRNISPNFSKRRHTEHENKFEYLSLQNSNNLNNGTQLMSSDNVEVENGSTRTQILNFGTTFESMKQKVPTINYTNKTSPSAKEPIYNENSSNFMSIVFVDDKLRNERKLPVITADNIFPKDTIKLQSQKNKSNYDNVKNRNNVTKCIASLTTDDIKNETPEDILSLSANCYSNEYSESPVMGKCSASTEPATFSLSTEIAAENLEHLPQISDHTHDSIPSTVKHKSLRNSNTVQDTKILKSNAEKETTDVIHYLHYNQNVSLIKERWKEKCNKKDLSCIQTDTTKLNRKHLENFCTSNDANNNQSELHPRPDIFLIEDLHSCEKRSFPKRNESSMQGKKCTIAKSIERTNNVGSATGRDENIDIIEDGSTGLCNKNILFRTAECKENNISNKNSVSTNRTESDVHQKECKLDTEIADIEQTNSLVDNPNLYIKKTTSDNPENNDTNYYSDDKSDCISLFADTFIDEDEIIPPVQQKPLRRLYPEKKSRDVTDSVFDNYVKNTISDFNKEYQFVIENNKQLKTSIEKQEAFRTEKKTAETTYNSCATNLKQMCYNSCNNITNVTAGTAPISLTTAKYRDTNKYRDLFRGLCYTYMKYGSCVKRGCRYQHNLDGIISKVYHNHYEKLMDIMEYLESQDSRHFLKELCMKAVSELSDTDLILQIFRKLCDTVLLNGPLTAQIITKLLCINVPLKTIINQLVSFVKSNDFEGLNFILKEAEKYIKRGEYWDTMKGLIAVIKYPKICVIECILEECVTLRQQYAQDINENLLKKLESHTLRQINQELMLSFQSILNPVSSKNCLTQNVNELPIPETRWVTENNITLPSFEGTICSEPESINEVTLDNENYVEKCTVTVNDGEEMIYEETNSEEELIDTVNPTSNNEKRLEELTVTVVNKKVTASERSSEDSLINTAHPISSNKKSFENLTVTIANGKKTVSQENNSEIEASFVVHQIQDLQKPYSVLGRNKFWKFYLDVHRLQQGLKQGDYKYVIDILKMAKEHQETLYTRACYKILCNEVKHSQHHLTNIISLTGNEYIKTT